MPQYLLRLCNLGSVQVKLLSSFFLYHNLITLRTMVFVDFTHVYRVSDITRKVSYLYWVYQIFVSEIVRNLIVPPDHVTLTTCLFLIWAMQWSTTGSGRLMSIRGDVFSLIYLFLDRGFGVQLSPSPRSRLYPFLYIAQDSSEMVI